MTIFSESINLPGVIQYLDIKSLVLKAIRDLGDHLAQFPQLANDEIEASRG